MKIIGSGAVVKLEKKPRKDCRKWRIVFKTDSQPITRRFSGTYSKACAERDRLLAELQTPMSEIAFLEWSEKWLSLREGNPDYADSTISKYRRQIRVLNRGFAKMKLCEITPVVAEETLLRLRDNDGDTLSGTYMNQIHALMNQIMEKAEDEGLIPKNPLRKIKAPKIDTKPRRSLDRDSFRRFLDTLDHLPLDAHTVGARLAVMGGMRRGEICALRWGGVVPGIIQVRNSIGENGKVKDPKTFSGIRNIPMLRQLERDLSDWKAVQRAQLAAIGIEQSETTPVCASATGGYMNPQNLDRWWRGARGDYGLDGIVLHELRHTFLTMLGGSGASGVAIKRIAGWRNLAMADTYIHDDAYANREAMDSLQTTIDDPSREPPDIPFDVPPDIPQTKSEARNHV